METPEPRPWPTRTTGCTQVRDVSFDEDRSQTRTGNSPHVMASLRNTAIGLLRLTGWDNIASGLRHYSRDPDRAINYLLTC